MSENKKHDVFRLPQVVAAIEKFDITVKQVFNNASGSEIQFSLVSVFELLDDDIVLSFIMSNLNQSAAALSIDEWIETNKKNFKGKIGSGYYMLPQEKNEKIYIIKKLLIKIITDGIGWVDDVSMYWFVGEGESVRRLCFLKEFLGSFYRVIMNMLIDLRVKPTFPKTITMEMEHPKPERVSLVFW
jgi:hypothetical protein